MKRSETSTKNHPRQTFLSQLRTALKITHVSHTSSDGKNSHKLNINNYDTEPSTKYFYFLSEQSPKNNEEAKTLVAKYKNQRVLGYMSAILILTKQTKYMSKPFKHAH